MAITGSGTQEDPYIVQSYTDLKSLPQVYYRLNYAKLGNDINCNDYGESFEWETVNLGGNVYPLQLDLDGHTIKNIPVKKDNSLFNYAYSGNYGSSDFVGNGKLLNVFQADSSNKNLIIGRGRAGFIKNLSMSVHLGKGAKGVFRRLSLEQVSLYIEQFESGTDIDDAIILSFDSDDGSGVRLKNCDFEVHVENMHTCLYRSNYYTDGHIVADGCRFRGKIKNASGSSFIGSMIANGAGSNCVVGLDASEMLSSTNLKFTDYTRNTNGVIDSTVKPPDSASTMWANGFTECTTSEIRNGDALRAKGFTVVNVSG